MEELLNNSWVIGIGGGLISAIVSSVLAYLITWCLTTVMRRKRVGDANQFLINHLRSYIIKGIIPSDTLANALRANAAKKFKVKESDLLSLPSLIAEIATEIVDIAYLQEADQMRYLENIDTYLSEHREQIEDKKESVRQMLSVSIIITFFVSSLTFVLMLEYMRERPNDFTELYVELLQDMDNMQLFTLFLFFIEIMVCAFVVVPAFFVTVWKTIGHFFAFLKNNMPIDSDKTD